LLISCGPAPPRHLPPFPTRRSSDLFAADPDVMDTWATSSLTPQIAGRWEDDPDLFGRVFPYDLRPQGHDIIRTWLFSTVVRAHRSEEHTSELQSRENLVCRLLLEKK